MGGTKSKGQVLSPPGKFPQAQQPQEPKYPGPSAQYHFINVQVSMQQHATFSFHHSNMVSSNVESYYPNLAAKYEEGFRMLTFYHIPGQAQHAGGFFNPAVLMPFQGIFCCYPQAPSNERYQLHIEKSIIQPQMMFTGFLTSATQTVTNTNHLYQTIMNNANRGGRLICIELTGQEQQQHSMGFMQHHHSTVMGCDLFFEMPLHPPTDTYMYHVVCEPIHVHITGGFAPRPVVQCNWLGVLQANMGQGWKLVEIFLDASSSSQMRGFSAQTQLNSQWIFEKPASRMNDPTPVYQGTFVEHEIVIKQSGFSGTKTVANWEPIIQNMGNNGWELACILETPDQKVSGFARVTMKVLLFFQRKIIPDGVAPPAGAMGYPQPPPLAMPPGPGVQGPPNPSYGAPSPGPSYGAPPPGPSYGAPPPGPSYGAPPPSYESQVPGPDSKPPYPS